MRGFKKSHKFCETSLHIKPTREFCPPPPQRPWRAIEASAPTIRPRSAAHQALRPARLIQPLAEQRIIVAVNWFDDWSLSAWPVSSGYMAAMRSCAIGSTSSPRIVRRRLHATIIHVAVPSARNCRRCGSGRVREQAMADFKSQLAKRLKSTQPRGWPWHSSKQTFRFAAQSGPIASGAVGVTCWVPAIGGGTGGGTLSCTHTAKLFWHIPPHPV